MVTMEAVPVRRGRPTADDARQKMAQVLTVACEQFSELGYRAVTMRDVADKARVSTRTLYNRYADKLSLFSACLDHGAAAFPRIDPEPGEPVDEVLRRYAVEVVKTLSTESSVRLGMLVYREGGDFPELLRAAEANQNSYLVQPLSAFLQRVGLARSDGDEPAKIFLAMALSEWQRRVTFRWPMQNDHEIDCHATLAVEIFLYGRKTTNFDV